MTWWMKTWNSSIGLKWIMGLTGAGVVLFVLGHLAGNLQIFLGPHALNRYAHALQSLGELLWVIRGGLVVIFALHVITAVRLTVLNRAARGRRYEVQKAVRVGLSSRTLLLSGIVVLAFVAYHLAHFTLGTADPEIFHVVDENGDHDVYSMVVLGFRVPAVAILYVIAVFVLSVHLNHTISSIFQTLGLNRPKYQALISRGGPVLAGLVFLGYASIPVSVLLRLLGLPGEGSH